MIGWCGEGTDGCRGDAAITAGGSGNGLHRAAAEAGEARREAAVAPPRAGGGSGAERGGGSGADSNTCLRGASSAGAERSGCGWLCPAGR